MRALVAAAAAVALICTGCDKSRDASEDVVDTTLNGAADPELAGADANMEMNLGTDDVQSDAGIDAATEIGASTEEEASAEFEPPAARSDPSPDYPVGPSRATSRSGSLSTLFSNDDYPASALSSGEQGMVQAMLEIDESGRVMDCTVTRSSGSAALDSATCSILRRRARFVPARDEGGQAVTDQMSTSIVWRLE